MIKIIRIIERQPIPDEHDDCPDFVIDDEVTDEVGFRELVELMRRFTFISSMPSSGAIMDYLSTYPDTDYRTGDEITETMHYAHENHPAKNKYWRKALKASGFIK